MASSSYQGGVVYWRQWNVAGAVIAAVCLWAIPGVTQETVAGEFDRLMEIAEGEEHRAARLAAAHGLGAIRPYLPRQEMVQRLGPAVERADDPMVGYILARQMARVELEAGMRQRGDDPAFAEDFGCLVDWELVGPFENPSMQGFEEVMGPEAGEPGPFPGRNAEVHWRQLTNGHYLCSFQLGARVHPSTAAVVYLASTVESDEGGQAQLLVGSRSAYRIWVNGEPVGQRVTGLGLGIDAEGWSVDLEPGANEILVKLASSGQGGLSFTARLTDLDDTPLVGWQAAPGVRVGAVRPFVEVGSPEGGALVAIEEATESDADGAGALAAATLWRRLYQDDASTPWRNVADRLAGELSSLSAREVVFLARLYEEHWQRLAILDAAVELGMEDPLLRLERAVELGRGMSRLQWQQQRRELEELVAQEPEFLMAREALTRWFEEHQGAQRALRELLAWEAEERESIPAWVRRAAQLHEDVGDVRRASELREKTAQLYQMSGTYGWNLIRQSMAGGDAPGAAQRVATYRARSPWSRQWGLQDVMLRHATGDATAALMILDALIEEAPGDAVLRQRRAELRLAMGDRDGAMEAAEEAIALRPQDMRYQEFLEHLQSEGARFYEPWVIGELRQLDEQTPRGSQSFDFLVDQRIQQVASNGLSRRFEQRVHRVLSDQGVNPSRQISVSYQPGDERVEVLGVRVLKADGTISEDYDDWTTSRTRQSARMYNDRSNVNMRANNVDVGDLVEFRYVVHQVANENFRGDYFGDVRYVQRARPVAMGRYAVIYPQDWELHFRHPAGDYRRWDDALPGGEPLQGVRVAAFEMTGIPRVLTDADQPGSSEVYDYILVSNKGTYDEIGAWWWELIEEQLVVDDAIRDAVREVTRGLTDDNEKLEAIYEYVVRNTRYLHLGLGIHGWKPYRTSAVFRNRYGDCKDKAALLKVMLEEANIEAEMVLVRTRRLGLVDDYPASMHVFNHAVTYVPSMDLFLDPTARFNGPYELTQMDQGAQALIVRDGGETNWLTMPVDRAEQNLLRESLTVDLREATPIMSGSVEAHGTYAVNDRRQLEDGERRDDVFEDRLRRTYSGLVLRDAEYDDLDGLTVPTRIRYTAEVPAAMRGTGSEATIYPYVAPRGLLRQLARQSTRNQDLVFRVPFAREAQIRYQLAPDQAIEEIPGPTHLSSDFGEMDLTYDLADRELIVDLRYAILVQRVTVEDYPEFRRFVAQMDEALNESIRLIETEVSR